MRHRLGNRPSLRHTNVNRAAQASTLQKQIAFFNVPGGRVAYSTTGHGPVMVFPPAMFAQLGLEPDDQAEQRFYDAFAERFTVVRYDRLGAGLSDRHRPPETLTLEAEFELIDALADELALRSIDLFGFSYGGAIAAGYAAWRPGRVGRLVLLNSFANGAAVSPSEVRGPIVAIVRANWALGARLLAEMLMPKADPNSARAFAQYQEQAVGAQLAAAFLEMCHRTDLRDRLGAVKAPTLVLHRRHDEVTALAHGRELAALVPNARLEVLEGHGHLPWVDDAATVVAAAGRFLGVKLTMPRGPSSAGDAGPVLTARETEVLRLVAEGLNDAEIARRLYLSPHTVHRHMANIRARLGFSSRAAAAAHAARLSLI